MLSHAGDTLPWRDTSTLTHCLIKESALVCQERAIAAWIARHLSVLQDDWLYWHSSKEGSSLEGQKVISVGGGTLQPQHCQACPGGLHGAPDDNPPVVAHACGAEERATSGNSSIGLCGGPSPDAACCMRSFTAAETPCRSIPSPCHAFNIFITAFAHACLGCSHARLGKTTLFR